MGLVNHKIKTACPCCGRPNLIYRRERNDYICGWCKVEFIKIGTKLIEAGKADGQGSH